MSDSCPTPADRWALEAAKLPLAFAQVREDPRLDVEIAATLPDGATVVMIASGGETLVGLARMPHLTRIHAVDMNASQLALSRLKCHLAAHHEPDESCRVLGHSPMPQADRMAMMRCLLQPCNLAEDVFGPPDFVAAHGVDQAGRYERCFAELRAALGTEALVNEYGLDAAMRRVMSLANLVTLFGQEATQNPALPFHEHFAARTRVALHREGAEVNPFLWQMYRGSFAAGYRYDWLESTEPLHAEVVWHHGRMLDVLSGMPAASADLVHLSNILDWLSPTAAEATLRATQRVLRPGGRVFIRQLNSSLDLHALSTGLHWDIALAADMESRDRSFFYPHLHLGTRA